jgi:hypothetical protein
MNVSVILGILAKKAADYAKNWAQKSARPRGEWAGKFTDSPVDNIAAIQAGYRSGTPCRFFLPDLKAPLTFIHESGVKYRFDPAVSDGGSTPVFTRTLNNDWADLRPFGRLKQAFYAHDSMYAESGCWIQMPGWYKGDWRWMPLTRAQADLLFFQMLTVTGRKAECFAIWRAVRRFGRWAWRRHRARWWSLPRWR